MGDHVTEKEHIRRSLKEAELYQSQGLLQESREKYLDLLKFIGESQRFSNHQKLIDAIKGKVEVVEKSLSEVEEGPKTLELSHNIQELIKNLFTFSETKEAAAMEGAVALAKFGQYERALTEFHKLLDERIMPVVTAKNIIRCYFSLNTPDAALTQFKKWLSLDLLSNEELNYVRAFLKGALEKQGIEAEIPAVAETAQVAVRPKTKKKKEQEVLLDISGISIRFDVGPLQGQTMDFDVDFQSSNTISIVISVNQKELAQSLMPGTRLSEMQCYSPITVFRSNGVVSGKAAIKQGPRKGDYMVDITIEGD